MKSDLYIFAGLFVMAAVSYAVRSVPIAFLKKPITNKYVQAFLYYVPYVTLAVMTFPAIIYATQTPISGLIALIVGCVLGLFGAGLFPIAISCCGAVLIAEFFLV
ncbi:MAG: AzlD domain-containing protein [Lachnospiraceae bacterium]|nr:AzlD domain-containing protein [Lachnospiraceae bacterium]